ncbi:putative TetR-family transcriptional regulator [Streptomyces avermitilis MA-4680 = NBRC 14893]|uniref:TetR-family transcriptional regulator n=1 Tax=Streptomyces avermitilis (strain ATCC 31267 / DSM 46492 / JCM 5070 / NBRC 14893 / NCIMB 12804 / NRRL 8165 / MA-4680) TaxID=227882 RepID=Q82Q46_STRAW|nr:putative TetR-family transcriptional regulator [Streptomyces avermitilis MA-4680 = NBRC 14893]
MRADARKNRDHLLAVAGAAITEQGVDVSLRDIARRAEVGLATLLRHFPTREALLDALLHTSFDELTAKAGALGTGPGTYAAGPVGGREGGRCRRRVATARRNRRGHAGVRSGLVEGEGGDRKAVDEGDVERGETVVAHRLLAARDRRVGGRVVQSAQQLRRSGDLGGRPVTCPEVSPVLTVLKAEALADLGRAPVKGVSSSCSMVRQHRHPAGPPTSQLAGRRALCAPRHPHNHQLVINSGKGSAPRRLQDSVCSSAKIAITG